MATSPSRAPDSSKIPGKFEPWIRGLWVAIFVAAAAIVAGTQIAAPNKRALQVLAAGALIVAGARVSSFTSLLFLVIAIPFRKPTTYGGTTLAFVLLIFIIWLIRLRLRTERGEGRSPMDLPVVALLCSFLLSFSQISTPEQLRLGLFTTFVTLTHISVCYLVMHLTHTEKQLRQLVAAILVMAALVQLTALYELVFPGRPLIAGWIELTYQFRAEYIRKGLEVTNMRIGGAFGDYELLAEFCGMIMLLLWFVLVRCRTTLSRIGTMALIFLNTFVLLATVTRGAIVSLAVAAVYLGWKARRRIRFHTFLLTLFGILAIGAAMLGLVTHTRSGNILERLEKTEFKGVVPETRVGVWSSVWERILQKPIFGHGPFYAPEKGVEKVFWPHNNYLFFWHMLGIIGLAALLWVLYTAWREARYHAPGLGDESFSRSLLLALRGMLLLFLVDQIKIDYVRNDIYGYWVWLFLGFMMATARMARRDLTSSLRSPEVEDPARRRRPVLRVAPSRAA